MRTSPDVPLFGLRLAAVVLALLLGGCAGGRGGEAVQTEGPASEVVVASGALPPEPPPVAGAVPSCPGGLVFWREKGTCVKVVHENAPAWRPPEGDPSRLDPCGAWDDPVGLVNCNPENEHPPAAAASGAAAASTAKGSRR